MRTSLTVLWLLVGTSAVVVPGHQGHLADDSDKMREEENDAFLEAATMASTATNGVAAAPTTVDVKVVVGDGKPPLSQSSNVQPAYGTQTTF